jgi:hypothetical protein
MTVVVWFTHGNTLQTANDELDDWNDKDGILKVPRNHNSRMLKWNTNGIKLENVNEMQPSSLTSGSRRSV